MSNITVCVRFRPLSSKERRDHGDGICIRSLDAETFTFKDEKQEEYTFSFDRVFYEGSEQADVYEFLALPIVRDAVNGINGTIITYGQTGAGKTYSMEGPSILDCVEQKKGLLPRVVDEIFKNIKFSEDTSKYMVKLSMVEIYMEKVRDLFDLSKDNIQIKESKVQGILLSGATEISLLDPAHAAQVITSGIANRAVGETQMNMASSRSHCVYIFIVQREITTDKREITGKLVFVDLAGSEKIEKTGAEGLVLEEAKTINKSLSALGNVINALTCGTPSKANHIPYRDSKLTRILQDALGGNSRTALLCCCSPSPSNALESLSTLRFGARAKHIKASPRVSCKEDKYSKKHGATTATKDESCERILNKLREKLDDEAVKLLEELFIVESIFFDMSSVEAVESAYEDVTFRTISSLQQVVEELLATVEDLKRENKSLTARLEAAERSDELGSESGGRRSFVYKILEDIVFFLPWLGSFFHINSVK
ncbi:kinesin-like protein KIN-1 isoform X1 [Actinidia eriantha]|uniref:kinesin-like protein KIN-1 isoform X1 n=1 Tax=Actinidia eriantha TaxID=165200 RepID=UPI00259125D8|nr:kinesin-like protein KIN-1 isoform X1 [Actinidia eriantha]